MTEASEIKLFIGNEPASHEELKDYVTSLIEAGVIENEPELILLSRAEMIIQRFHKRRHKQPLYDAVRNDPELFQLRMFREFVADVLEGSYRPKVRGTVSHSRAEKASSILAEIYYFKSMGLPTHYEGRGSRPNACQLTAERLNIPIETVKEECKAANKQKFFDSRVSDGPVHRAMHGEGAQSPSGLGIGFFAYSGIAIWALNGFYPPSSEEEIEELESILSNMSSKERGKSLLFCSNFNPHTCPQPTTQDELDQIEGILSKNQTYEIIKRYQRQPLRIR